MMYRLLLHGVRTVPERIVFAGPIVEKAARLCL